MEPDPLVEGESDRTGGIRTASRGVRRTSPALMPVLAIAALFAIMVVTLWPEDLAIPGKTESKEDVVADLLAWIPATDITSRTFTVWSPDPGDPTSEHGSALQIALALEPRPLTLGHSVAWESRFGWQIGDVSSWAVAGSASEIAILAGSFDTARIEEALLSSGYRRGQERGVVLYTIDPDFVSNDIIDGDSTGSARVVALLEGRVITSSSLDLVRDSIDVVLDGAGSLADEEPVAVALRTLAPISALVAINQADHAASCVPDAFARPDDPDTRRFIIVGYGRIGEGGERRTMIAATFLDQSEASAHSVQFERGWIDGFANAGGAGGSIDSFGTLSSVSQTGSMLIAELVDGRDGGWVRAGIRYAIPACEIAMALSPAATPMADGSSGEASTSDRILSALPDSEQVAGTPVVTDLAGLSETAEVAMPGSDATQEEIEAWLTAVGPLPVFSIVDLTSTGLAEWIALFDLPLSSVHGLGQAPVTSSRPPVGVMIGDWDLLAITATLGARGYDWIDIGDVRHFAYEGPDLESALPGLAWENLAILGDRMWFSEDQLLMRDVIEQVLAKS